MTRFLRSLLAAFVVGVVAFAQDTGEATRQLGRLRERLRSDSIRFDALFVRALRLDDVERDELEPYLENDAFVLRARAVELLAFLDEEREWSPFARTLDALLEEEARLADPDARVLAAFARSHAEGVALDALITFEREGVERLRREIAKTAWRRGGRASRAALAKLVRSDAADAFAARALLDVGAAGGLDVVAESLLGRIDGQKKRAKARREFQEELESLAAKRETSAELAALDEDDRKAAESAFHWWRIRAKERLDEADRVPVELAALLAETAERRDLPAVPKKVDGESSWKRWHKRAAKKWPASIEPGPVRFGSRELFAARLAKVEARLEAAWSDAHLLDGLDELDAGFGAQRLLAPVTESLCRRLLHVEHARAPRGHSRHFEKQRSSFETRAHLLRLITLRADANTRTEWVTRWAEKAQSRNVFLLPLGRTRSPDLKNGSKGLPHEQLSSEWNSHAYGQMKPALGPSLAALDPDTRRNALARLVRGQHRLYHLGPWAAELLLGPGTRPRDWHAAVAYLIEIETATKDAEPLIRLELAAARTELAQLFTRFAIERNLASPPPADDPAEAWTAWIEEAAPVR